jgi:hypothetical protein
MPPGLSFRNGNTATLSIIFRIRPLSADRRRLFFHCIFSGAKAGLAAFGNVWNLSTVKNIDFSQGRAEAEG